MGKSSSKNLDPTTEAARTCLIRGKKLFRSSNYNEAIRAVEKALELKPNYSEALFLKGRCLGRLNKNEEALNWYDKAIQLGHVGACNFKGFLMTNKQDSIELFKKALQLNKNPSNATKLVNKGLSFEGLEKFAKAIQYYDKAIRIRPNYELAHFNKGFAFFNLRKYEKAIKCFDKALKINPNDESAFTAKGACLSNLDRYQEAVGCFNRAIEIAPHISDAYSGLGDALFNLGKHELAIQAFNKAVDISPTKSEVTYYIKHNSFLIFRKNQQSIENFRVKFV